MEQLEPELQRLLSLPEIKHGHFMAPDGSAMTAPPPIDSRLNSVLIAPC